MPENPASYRVVRKKSYLFNKAVHQVKLTDKPLSFGYSVVDSHSSFCPSKSKNPPKRVFT
ncbi:hypothetical protein D5Z66_19360 [Escherichia coli]|nr:hypothetical protein [Escherichia coli]